MKDASVFIGREIQTETRKWLFSEKVDFEESSLFQIELNKPDVSSFQKIEYEKRIFLITSKWAAKWLVLNAGEIGFKPIDFIFCLSKKQEEICTFISQNIFITEEKNVGSLANLVLAKTSDEYLIYLKGNKSLNILKSILEPLRNRFFEFEVYRNLPLVKKVDKKFAVYVFFSPSGVSNFFDSGNRIPENSKIVAIGTTTAITCRSLFSNEVLISPVQEEVATVKYAVNSLKINTETEENVNL